MDSLLSQLQHDFPEVEFILGPRFSWSPRKKQITYTTKTKKSRSAPWSLLHELGHALLDHHGYTTDMELVKLESQAWHKAKEVGVQYGFEISEDYIEDCMDTYRDWLHRRSACPQCNTRSLQQDSKTYKCFNCGQTWTVSGSRFCRPYRMTSQTKTSPSAKKTTFV